MNGTGEGIEYYHCSAPVGPFFSKANSPSIKKTAASFDAPPSSDGCNTTTTTTGQVCGINLTTHSTSKSCVTLSCGTASAIEPTNRTDESFGYISKICICKEHPEQRGCAYALRTYVKNEQVFSYVPLGGGGNHLRCTYGTTIDQSSLPSACGNLQGLGTFSLISLSDGPNSCSWLAVNGH